MFVCHWGLSAALPNSEGGMHAAGSSWSVVRGTCCVGIELGVMRCMVMIESAGVFLPSLLW